MSSKIAAKKTGNPNCNSKKAFLFRTFYFPVACAIVLLSSFSCLSYEIAWSRILILTVGNSSESQTYILTSFMLGFGIGALSAGKLTIRANFSFLLLSIIQALIALEGFFFTPLLNTVTSYFLYYPEPVNVIISLFISGVPSILMGSTIPLVLKAIWNERHSSTNLNSRKDIQAALILALSAAGGCAGAGGAGYFFIPLKGNLWTSQIAAYINFLCCALALFCFFFSQGAKTELNLTEKFHENEKTKKGDCVFPVFAYVASFTAGFYLLSMEIVWRRFLVLIFGHDTYGFTAMLLGVVLFQAVGAFTGTALLKLFPAKSNQAAFIFILISSISGPLSMVLYSSFFTGSGGILPNLFPLVSTTSSQYAGIISQLLTASIITGPASFSSGAVLPLLCGNISGKGAQIDETSRPVSKLLFVNYLGCGAGSAFTFFLLIGLVGLQYSASISGILFALAGAMLLPPKFYFSAAVVLTLCLLPPGIHRQLFIHTSGGKNLKAIYYKEGRTSTIAVTVDTIDGEKQLLINAVNEVTTRFVHDQSFAMMGHLPMLLHPNPERVLVISFGAGISAGAVASHKPKTLDAVDLEREVTKASTFFKELNDNVTEKSFFHLFITDGRRYLQKSNLPYDVIIVDSTHPRSIDSWVLYTHEFYETAIKKLRKNGLIVQWIPLHGMSIDEFKIIISTFLKSFSNSQLWVNAGWDCRGFAGYALLVGSLSNQLVIDLNLIEDKLKNQKINKHLGKWHLNTPEAILSCYIASSKTLKKWTAGLPLITDDMPVIPFVTKWSKSARIHPSVLTAILEPSGPSISFTNPEKIDRIANNIHERYFYTGKILRGEIPSLSPDSPYFKLTSRFEEEKSNAIKYYNRLLSSPFLDDAKIADTINTLRGLGVTDQIMQFIEKTIDREKVNEKLIFESAKTFEEAGDFSKAEELYRRILTSQKNAVSALNNLALIVAGKGNFKEAIELLKKSRNIDPYHPKTYIALAKVDMMRLDFNSSLEWLKMASTMDKYDPTIYNMMGLSFMNLMQTKQAIKYFQKAIRLDPFWDEPFLNAGVCLTMSGNYQDAITYLATAVELNPENDMGWLNLGFAFKYGGKMEEAVSAFKKALELNPELASQILNEKEKNSHEKLK